jgi:hypothetical protein
MQISTYGCGLINGGRIHGGLRYCKNDPFYQEVLWDLNIPQEAATMLYKDNDGCTTMGNAQKPTSRTCHIDIKYFLICEWVEQDLVLLDRFDTLINMSDHLTKALQPLLFHCHADFLLGHIPPMNSPVYQTTVGHITNHTDNLDSFVPQSFTTPLTAVAAQAYTTIASNYLHSPYLRILGRGQYNPQFHVSSSIVDCGGVTLYRLVDT